MKLKIKIKSMKEKGYSLLNSTNPNFTFKVDQYQELLLFLFTARTSWANVSAADVELHLFSVTGFIVEKDYFTRVKLCKAKYFYIAMLETLF